jgi:hypothetical protein
MNSPTALFNAGLQEMAQAGRVEHSCGCSIWRNDNENGAEPETQSMIRLAKAEWAIRRLYRAIDELPSHERFPFSYPMEDVFAETASTQESWVPDTEAYLPKAFTRIKKQEKMNNHALEEYGFYGIRSALLEFIGELVGFFSLYVFFRFRLESCRSSQAHPFSFTLLSFYQPGTA